MTVAPASVPDLQETAAHRNRRIILLALTLVVATLIAYWPAIGAGFIWDDGDYVTENALVHSPDGLGPIWSLRFADSPTSVLPVVIPNTPQYYPLVFTSFWVENALWGHESAAGYHLVNILLHSLNAILIWLVFSRMGVRGAWLIGAIFALHPVHVESVAWITERKNVLSALFYLSSALAWLRFDALLEQPAAERRHGGPWPWYLLSLGLFVCALLSKTITCSLPAALILVMLFTRRSFTVPRIVSLIPMFVVGLFFAWITSNIEANIVGAGNVGIVDELDYSLAQRILIASNALLFYVSKMLWPYPLVFIYPRWAIDQATVLSWWTVVVVLGVAVVCVVAFARGRRGVPLALAYFAGTVLPALGLVALVYPHRFSFVADHFNYLSSIGIIAIIVALLLRIPVRQRAYTAISAAVLLALGVLTFAQSRIYADEETLWLHTISHNRASWMPQNNLASIYLSRAATANEIGDLASAERFAEKSREHAAASVRIKPDHDRAHSNLANALRLLGRVDDALAHAVRAAELQPEQAEYHVHVARLCRLADAPDAAVDAYSRAVDTAPEAIQFQFEFADYLVQLQRFDEALPRLRAIIEKQPGHVPALVLVANVRSAQGQYETAARFFAAAVQAATTAPLRLLVLPHLTRFYANCPDPNIRNFETALAAAGALVQLTQGNHTALGMLADVQYKAGDIDPAIQTALQAATAAQSAGDSAFAQQMLEAVELYRESLSSGEPPSDDDS